MSNLQIIRPHPLPTKKFPFSGLTQAISGFPINFFPCDTQNAFGQFRLIKILYRIRLFKCVVIIDFRSRQYLSRHTFNRYASQFRFDALRFVRVDVYQRDMDFPRCVL
jgi:hypothetical protein